MAFSRVVDAITDEAARHPGKMNRKSRQTKERKSCQKLKTRRSRRRWKCQRRERSSDKTFEGKPSRMRTKKF